MQDANASNQKLLGAEQQKLKMQNLATEFNSKVSSERKRLENLNNIKQQIQSYKDILEQAVVNGMIIMKTVLLFT